MARHRDDDTTRAEEAVAKAAAVEGDPTPDRPDPLGLGGTPPPDAPSRRAKPEIIALLGEFLRMSRTSAVLLGAFVLAGALYLLVREQPVVAFGPPAPPASSAPTEPVDPSPTPTEEATQTTVPTPTTSADPTATDTRPTATTAPQGNDTTSPRPDGRPGGAGQQAPPQEQSTPQQPTQQQPDQQSQPQLQQQVPGSGEAAAPGGGALEG